MTWNGSFKTGSADMFLYRGVSNKFHDRNEGKLKPKCHDAFNYTFHWEEHGLRWDSGSTWDSSVDNAVIRHQLNQEGFPTSGISTTPHLERAIFYARGKSGNCDGFVYKIDRAQLDLFNIRTFVVAAYAIEPSVTEDDEVILVTPGAIPLPSELIEVIPLSEVLKNC